MNLLQVFTDEIGKRKSGKVFAQLFLKIWIDSEKIFGASRKKYLAANIKKMNKVYHRRTYDVIKILEGCEYMKINLKNVYLNNYKASTLNKRYLAIDQQ